MHAEVGLVEIPARVLAPREVAARPESDPVSHGMLVFPARPERETHPRGGELLLVAAERQGDAPNVDLDKPLVRRGPDVAVRGQRRPEVEAPALTGPDLGEEALHVRDDRRGKVPREDLLEVPAGEGVLALRKNARASSSRTRASSGRSINTSRKAAMAPSSSASRPPPAVRLLRRPHRREAEQKEGVGLELPAPNQRPQNNQSFREAAGVDSDCASAMTPSTGWLAASGEAESDGAGGSSRRSNRE